MGSVFLCLGFGGVKYLSAFKSVVGALRSGGLMPFTADFIQKKLDVMRLGAK